MTTQEEKARRFEARARSSSPIPGTAARRGCWPRRISLATSLYRAAMTGLLDAAREVKDNGTFTYLDRSLATPELAKFMQE